MHTSRSACRQLAAGFGAALVVSLAVVGCNGTAGPLGGLGGPAVSATPTKRVIRPTEFVCDSPRIAALGLGLRVVRTKDDAIKLLRGVMPFPDPATLPADLVFDQAYVNSAMQGSFKQSTLSLVWLRGDGDFAIHYMNAYPPLEEPPKEPHTLIKIRDGKQAYLYAPPFREGLHSVMWREGCRYISVVGTATEEEVLAVAEGIRLPEDTPLDATLGDYPDALPPEKALPTVRFYDDATPVPGMTGTPVFGPDAPGWIPEATPSE